ncbi:protein kinase [Gregarina niphandrodes]|uniref:Protein kinase n=1 Tax=Gregarina niphandrodes TaxID=110365 RepID=A0A023B6U1_GRENI|nr:protein kinase [Gregarina niphandrodes]EZG66826.1 protein kinase [Gregarina niphandrodes]|eukprot:XP_011130469.1 protein kinase [Gregarina niphandrodes]
MPAAGLNYYGCITAIPPECICGGNIEELVEEQLSRGVLDIEGLREAVAAQPVTWYRPCAAFDVWALGVLTVELVLGWTPLQLVNLFGVDNAPLMPLGDQIRYVTSPAFWTALLKQLLAEQLVDSDCADFIALCTALSPVVRPTTSALMNHPFITKEKRSTTRQSPVQDLRRHFALRPPNVSHFELRNTVGTGTFGRVRLVRLKSGPSVPMALKILRKSKIIQTKQVEHVKSERNILQAISHPFIVNLITSFQDERRLYMLMEFVNGGELFSHLRTEGRLLTDHARFYAAEIVLAFEYLHGNHHRHIF